MISLETSQKVMSALMLAPACFLVLNIFRILKDKEVKGVSIICVTCFDTMSWWQTFYWWQLGKNYAMCSSFAISFVELIWLILLVYYSYKANEKQSG